MGKWIDNTCNVFMANHQWKYHDVDGNFFNRSNSSVAEKTRAACLCLFRYPSSTVGHMYLNRVILTLISFNSIVSSLLLLTTQPHKQITNNHPHFLYIQLFITHAFIIGGSSIKLPMTIVTLVENLLMMVMAGWMMIMV